MVHVAKFRGICRGLIEAEYQRRSHDSVRQNSAASAAASLKQPSDGWLIPTILLKFRGICRGLIEAIWVREKIARRAENSAASAAASLKLDRRLRVPVRTGKIPRHLPRPH